MIVSRQTFLILIIAGVALANVTKLRNGGRVIRDCPENEYFVQCRACEGTCENPEPVCTRMCRPAGCFCNPSDGFVRKNGRCIEKERCRPPNPIDVCKGFKCRAGTYCEPQHVKPCPDLTKPSLIFMHHTVVAGLLLRANGPDRSLGKDPHMKRQRELTKVDLP
ncbi:hypothetical protein QR680_006224 [Steinernema hermaphroditum]|uniref:TIL domain-containing protein n=1 Tax=Steinernema hermaphroditum TaxID=289476 RepID=A0AA39HWY8_9BILA|nr:hypothetical protein QR680_006224 [Steinernema hermaphroditum]